MDINNKYRLDCQYFSGYKPCQFKRSCQGCNHFKPRGSSIVILSLEALGAVIRSTCLLPPIKRKFPDCHITWITLPQSKPLLVNNPLIDRIVTLEPASVFELQYLQFDVLYAVDKSIQAGSIAQVIQAREKFGFGVNPQGQIVPFNPYGYFQYDVGLNDDLKFFQNKKPETQQITETMDLEWARDPYVFSFTQEELQSLLAIKHELQQKFSNHPHQNPLRMIGYNTGCSDLYPYKKFTVEKATELVANWRRHFPHNPVLLLGGREDRDRQNRIKESFANDPYVVNTPTDQGLRMGIIWLGAADVVFSGCSLGMHIAIALNKPTIAWFGVSCSHEIDLYDQGIKLEAQVECSPCWKKSCNQPKKCFDSVSLEEIMAATAQLLSAVDHSC